MAPRSRDRPAPLVIDLKAEGPDASDSRRHALLKGIKSFDVASGGGPTGLRPQHLREIMLQGEATGLCDLLDGLEALLICCANGTLAPPAVRVLCAARLFPLKKKNGGLRPIAVGETVRRLFEKVMMGLPETRKVCESLLPVQCGFGSHNVCEQITLSLQLK